MQIKAQNATTGEIVGTVNDPAGAVVVGAKVQLRNLAQNETRETQTSSAGGYRFSLLPPGKYEFRIEAKNFESLVRTVEVRWEPRRPWTLGRRSLQLPLCGKTCEE